MNGLMVAHLLAEDHGRRVCVEWRSFTSSFDALSPCPPRGSGAVAEVSSWNFGASTSAARLAQALASDAQWITFTGNEYPPDASGVFVWPERMPHLEHHYAFRLGDDLPPLPKVDAVAHLRLGDGRHDRRFDDGAKALLDTFHDCWKSRDVYLVSDSEQLYETSDVAQRPTSNP